MLPCDPRYLSVPPCGPRFPQRYTFLDFLRFFLCFFFCFPPDPIPFTLQHSHVVPTTPRCFPYPPCGPRLPQWYKCFRFFGFFDVFVSVSLPIYFFHPQTLPHDPFYPLLPPLTPCGPHLPQKV